MKRVNCGIVGERYIFDICIAEEALVIDLRRAIAQEFQATTQRVLYIKALYVAKNNGEWLHGASLDFLEKRSVDPYKDMAPPLKLLDPLVFGPNFELGENCIHVLVEQFEQIDEVIPRRLSTLQNMCKQSCKCGDLPKEGEFLNLFEWSSEDCGKVIDVSVISDIVPFVSCQYYLRKEALGVLKNFHSIYQRQLTTGQVISTPFILLGTSGTGKSSLLALICFYIAVHCKQPVLWHRRERVNPATRLFIEGKFFEWKDYDVTIYKSLYDLLSTSNPNCWFYLDGLCQVDVDDRLNLYSHFKLLTTSEQFHTRNQDEVKMCLLPYWNQADLESLNDTWLHWDKAKCAAHYYVSGGSLREFLDKAGEARNNAERAIRKISGSGNIEILLGHDGLGSDMHVDSVRSQGVRDTSDFGQYVNRENWICCVTSQYVLHRLLAMLNPNFFEKLISFAKSIGDDGLFGAARQEYFQFLVCQQKSLRVRHFNYHNAPKDVRICGHMQDEVMELLKRWASNLELLDFWMSPTCTFMSIDAIVKVKIPPDNEVQVCLLQLVKSTYEFCHDSAWQYAMPFVAKGFKVCYIAILADEAMTSCFKLLRST